MGLPALAFTFGFYKTGFRVRNMISLFFQYGGKSRHSAFDRHFQLWESGVYDAHHVYVDKWHGRGGSRGGIHEGLNKFLFLFFFFCLHSSKLNRCISNSHPPLLPRTCVRPWEREMLHKTDAGHPDSSGPEHMSSKNDHGLTLVVHPT